MFNQNNENSSKKFFPLKKNFFLCSYKLNLIPFKLSFLFHFTASIMTHKKVKKKIITKAVINWQKIYIVGQNVGLVLRWHFFEDH